VNTSINFFKNNFKSTNNKILISHENDSYVGNFGKQWKDYRDVQIDSINNFKISEKFFNQMLFYNLEILKNKNILEIGCGAGRFTEYLVKYANQCVSIDLSSAIFHNVSKNSSNLTLIKADFNDLIPDKKFDIVFCRGVLQHTPNPLISLKKIHTFVKKEGDVFFDIYKKPKIGYLHPKYSIWRPLIKLLISYDSFENFLKKNIKFLLQIKRIIKKLFFNSNFIADSLIPVWDYKDKLDLNEAQLIQWSIMDTLDGIYAKYDFPQSSNKIISFLKENEITLNEKNLQKNIFHTKVT